MSRQDEQAAKLAAITAQLRDKITRYKRVFGGEDGKKILEDLRARSFEDRTTYDQDHVKMGINEGRRSLYKYISSMVEKDEASVLADLVTGNPEPQKG